MSKDEVDSNIPEVARASIDAYVQHGLHPGGFLLAVLQNNLFDALFLADRTNRPALYHIAQYVYNKTPDECWGSPEATNKWLKHAGGNNG